MRRLATFTFDDLSISNGPSVHFLELWNAVYKLPDSPFALYGYSAQWRDAEPVIKADFNHRRLKVPANKILRYLVSDVLFALKIFRHRNDLVYIRLAAFSCFILLILSLFRIRPIVELNGIIAKDTLLSKRKRVNKVICNLQEKILIRQAGVCIAVSEEIAAHARAVGCMHTVVISNGIAAKYFCLPQKQHFSGQLVYVGTFTHRDGASKIIELAALFPQYHFHLVGDGPTRMNLESIAGTNVKFYGMIPYASLSEMYRRYDAGIVLYHHDIDEIGLSSLKTLEYLACGLPVFTTRVKGQTFIGEHALGVLTSFDDLVTSFTHFIENFDRWKKNVALYRKEMGRQMIWEKVAEAYTRNIMGDAKPVHK